MSDQTKVAEDPAKAASPRPPRGAAGMAATAGAGVERRPAGEKRGPKAPQQQKAGQAMEPPPVIRPKAKPQRATGEVKAVGAMPPVPPGGGPGGAPGSPAAGAGQGTGPTAAPGGKPARTFRTTKPATGPVVDDAPPTPGPATTGAKPVPPTTAVPATPVPGPGAAPRTTAMPTQAAVAAAGLTGTGTMTAAQGPKGGRRIKLSLGYVSPWSTAKMAFLISLAAGVAFVVMVFVLWTALDSKHVFVDLNDMVKEIAGPEKTKELNLLQYVAKPKIMSGAMLIAAVDVVIGTILATLGAIVYNILAALVGGVKVTLREF